MPNFTRRLWYDLTETGYRVEIRDGARIRDKIEGECSREEAAAQIAELAARFRVDEVREGI